MLLGGLIAHQLEHCISKQLERLYSNLRSVRNDKKERLVTDMDKRKTNTFDRPSSFLPGIKKAQFVNLTPPA
jgi:hypothetical protein